MLMVPANMASLGFGPCKNKTFEIRPCKKNWFLKKSLDPHSCLFGTILSMCHLLTL